MNHVRVHTSQICEQSLKKENYGVIKENIHAHRCDAAAAPYGLQEWINHMAAQSREW